MAFARLASVLVLALLGCGGPAPESGLPRVPLRPGLERRVLVVCNSADSGSVRIAEAYAARRHVPDAHRCALRAPVLEEITIGEYREAIEAPVRACLQGSSDSIDFIVLTRGVPLRIAEGGWSVDAFLGAMDLGLEPTTSRDPADLRRLRNPYFGSAERFTSAAFGIRLVTRLDGYTVDDALALIDRSLAARPCDGPFLLDPDPARNHAGYALVNRSIEEAQRLLRARGLTVSEEEWTDPPAKPLAGYYSWGSNDGRFRPEVFRALRFLPGALAETAVSTSARTFRPASGGQSLIADLVSGGVTGVKGYVSEPLSLALCRADLLFERYVSGYTLAESFYAATPLVLWKDVVVGDPLCAPYALRH